MSRKIHHQTKVGTSGNRNKGPDHILIRSPNWIGDQILAYPFYYFLRKAFPRSRIAVSCLPWVAAAQFRDLVDEVYVLAKAEDSTLLSKWKALEQGAEVLRGKGPWDLGITLPNSFSSAWLLFRSGVKRRRGYSCDGRSLLLTESVRWNRGMISHRAEAYVRLLPESVPVPATSIMEFWGGRPISDLDPCVPGVLDRFDAEKNWLETEGTGKIEAIIPPSEKYWVLAPGSTAESRRWPKERFEELARLVQSETKWLGVIVGGAAESEVAKYLAEAGLNILDWTARGQVTSYWKVFRDSQFTVSNDSGLAHVASLCGASVQVIWGAGNPKRTEPMGPGKVKLAINPVDCWPCESNLCSQPSEGKLQCLKGISADAVWKEIKTGIGIFS